MGGVHQWQYVRSQTAPARLGDSRLVLFEVFDSVSEAESSLYRIPARTRTQIRRSGRNPGGARSWLLPLQVQSAAPRRR